MLRSLLLLVTHPSFLIRSSSPLQVRCGDDVASFARACPDNRYFFQAVQRLCCDTPQFLFVCVSVLKQRAESGGHSRLPEVTGGVKGQPVLIRRDVLPWDLSLMRDNPLIGVS